MNETVTSRDLGSEPGPLVWCAWPITILNTQWFRLISFVGMIPFCLQLGGGRIIAFSGCYGYTLLLPGICMAVFFGIATTPAHDGDIFALSLILQHALHASMLALLFTSHRTPKKYVDFRPFYSGVCQFLFIVRMVLQYFSLEGPALNLPKSAVASTSCDASTGLCVNPCNDINVAPRYYHTSSDILVPTIWYADHIIKPSPWGSVNEWISSASQVNNSTFEGLKRYIWCAYFLTGPAFTCVRAIANTSPRESRNHIFRRLQQDYHPRSHELSKRRKLSIYLLIWTRYLLLSLSAVSMEMRIFLLPLSPATWVGKRLYKVYMEEKPMSWDEVVVLKHNHSPQRQRLAQRLALLWYLWSISFYLLFPAWVIFVTAKSELHAQWIPQAEKDPNNAEFIWWAVVTFGIMGLMLLYVSLEAKHYKGGKKIHITDPSLEEDGPEKIALLKRNIKDNDLSWPKYIMARLYLEWCDFRYWQSDPSRASVERKSKKVNDPWDCDETSPQGGGRGENPGLDGLSRSASLSTGFVQKNAVH